ncbi:MAG: tRNA lysidine(34) synthetase TilS, partial [Acidiferrobacterales bacterium]
MKKAEPGFSAGALGRTLTQRLGATSSLKVAYSGGLDSHVLLHALCQLRASAHWVISAIHVDHGLHPESARWAEHCQQVCEQLGVVCTVERIQVSDTDSLGTEAAARRLRYACFAQHIGYQDALLTAHHLDDQAETVLLQLLRGTGVRGLAGMPEVTAFSGGKLVRPLLEFTRAELAAYAESQGLHWVEDVSNRDVSYGRNFLRHQVLPLLEQRWPQASRLIARAGRHAG